MPKPPAEKAPRRGKQGSRPDPRPAARILEEEALLTKAMLAKVFGYGSVRSVNRLIEDDCAGADPCLKPVYLRVPHKRRGRSGALFPENFPSFRSLRFRREDVLRYIAKMQRGFPEDLEWRTGGAGTKR